MKDNKTFETLTVSEQNAIIELLYFSANSNDVYNTLYKSITIIKNAFKPHDDIHVVIQYQNQIISDNQFYTGQVILNLPIHIANKELGRLTIYSNTLTSTISTKFIKIIIQIISNILAYNELNTSEYLLRERVKELKGLQSTREILKQKGIIEALEEIVNILPQAWQYPEYTVARITYGSHVYVSKKFKQTSWVQKQEFSAPTGIKGKIEIFYLQEFPEAFEGPFLKEERELLENFAALISGFASINALNNILNEYTERLKELKALNEVSQILSKTISIERALQSICKILPEAWQYPEYAACRIIYGRKKFTSKNFSVSPWVQRQQFTTTKNVKGCIEIFYLKEFPNADEGPFLKEERDLLINITNLISGVASKKLLNQLLVENRERLKELEGINNTTKIIAEGLPLDETLQKICETLTNSWQYPSHTAVRIKYHDKIYCTKNFEFTPWVQQEIFTTLDNMSGSVEVIYLKEFPNADEGPFLKEERNLLKNIARLISGYIDSLKGKEFFLKKTATHFNENDTQKILLEKRQSLPHYFNKQAIEKYIYLDMMKYKVKEILFFATLYDSFILESEGHFFEQFMGEIIQYSLTTLPRITSVTTEEEVLELSMIAHFDLIILMAGIEPQTPIELAKKIKEKLPNIPIYLLINEKRNIAPIEKKIKFSKAIDKLFVWDGSSQIFFAIVKSKEDISNLENDTKVGLVRIILLIEDSVWYYSKYLPLLYSIIFDQLHHSLNDAENTELEKLRKIRSRPKIIHVTNFEEATYYFNRYKDFLLCVISDVDFEKEGKSNKTAGIQFLKHVRRFSKDLPFILQSAEKDFTEIAQKFNAAFVDKNSPYLLTNIKRYIVQYLSFGAFVFRNQHGQEIIKANNLYEFTKLLQQVPAESLYYHSQNNQFSLWLIGRGEIKLAKTLNPIKISDFSDVEAFRNYLVQTIYNHIEDKKKGKVVSLDENPIISEKHISSIFTGSYGGKGRGLAFINSLINNHDFSPLTSYINISVPKTIIIGTDEFRIFIEQNNLKEYLFKDDTSYFEIRQKFFKGKLTALLRKKLEKVIQQINRPLIVRSSSISEDSITKSFAGIFETYVIPNNHQDFKIRLLDLENAIKLIYASLYSPKAKSYFKSIKHSIEEEKMAIVIQEIVGEQYQQYYYPHISGVASSYNFYPVSYMKPDEGIAYIAFGLGHYVVEGGRSYIFSPVFPQVEFLSTKELVNNSQTSFVAVDLNVRDYNLIRDGEKSCLVDLDIWNAIPHGSLTHCASTYNIYNDNIEAGITQKGPLVINFANILKYNYIPLAATIDTILKIMSKAIGTPVEIEYAVNLNRTVNNLPTFYLLQVKPMPEGSNDYTINFSDYPDEKIILKTFKSVGNGKINYIKDIIVVNVEKFDKLKTQQMADEIEKLNVYMIEKNLPYILIGPGRWGTRDPLLGIPVNWSQISNAKVIVEIELNNFPVDASMGSHFFHNITSMNIGYLAVKANSDKEFIRWDIINNLKIVQKTNYFYHIRSHEAMHVIMDGKHRTAIITL